MYFVALFLLFHLRILAQCAGEEILIQITISPDEFPNETTWHIKDQNGLILVSGNVEGGQYCADPMDCLEFQIFDSYGDGICCEQGTGMYFVMVNGIMQFTGGDFLASESHFINCAPAQVCSTAIPLSLGNIITGTANSWYSFSPDTTGIYLFDFCNIPNLDCPIALYLYENCPVGIPIGPMGAITTSTVCVNNLSSAGASISTSLIDGEDYILRVDALEPGMCFQPILGSLTFQGAIAGCMDPLSCTYNTFAAIPDTTQCYYYPSELCPSGRPDLTIDAAVLNNSFILDTISNTDQCLLNEGCLSGYGLRNIIRFSTKIDNIGTADYVIGEVEESNSQFEFDECHGHYHYEGYAEYQLFDSNGINLPSGFKNGFCVLDLGCPFDITPQYTCVNMGITAGCSDEYNSALPCQWIDITDLPEGDYTFICKVNWGQKPDRLGNQELSYLNNAAQVCFNLQIDDITNAISISINPNCPALIDCAGITQGTAQLDCMGVCNGPNLAGDLDANGLQNLNDVQIYADASLSTQEPIISLCNDLNDDGQITGADAYLLSSCIWQNQNGGPIDVNWDHCQFPFSTINSNDTIHLRLGEYNQAEKYVVIELKNELAKISALHFSIDGIVPTNVVNLLSSEITSLIIDSNEAGELMAFSIGESQYIQKHTNFVPLLKVYYDYSVNNEVCLASIHNILNDDREECIKLIDGDCVSLTSVGFENTLSSIVNLWPNPIKSIFNVVVDRSVTDYTIIISNTSSQILYNQHFTTNSEITIDTKLWNSGLYNVQIISDQRNLYNTKIVKI